MVATTPFCARALSFDFRIYSSRTIEAEPDDTTRTVTFKVAKGEVKNFRSVYCKGSIRVNLAGTWRCLEK